MCYTLLLATICTPLLYYVSMYYVQYTTYMSIVPFVGGLTNQCATHCLFLFLATICTPMLYHNVAYISIYYVISIVPICLKWRYTTLLIRIVRPLILVAWLQFAKSTLKTDFCIVGPLILVTRLGFAKSTLHTVPLLNLSLATICTPPCFSILDTSLALFDTQIDSIQCLNFAQN